MRNHVAAIALGAIVTAVLAGIALADATAVGVRNTSLGKVLVNHQGRTLYLFARDRGGKSACYGVCAKYWPPLITGTMHVAGAAGVKPSLLGTTKRRDGRLQVTYNHHPLYRYLGDAKAGDTKGEGLNLSGGLWWAVSPAGAAVKKPSGGGGGYGGGAYP